MKRLAVLGLVVALVSASWAGTAQDKWNAQIQKTLPLFGSFLGGGKLSKYLCEIVTSPGDTSAHIGVLEWTGNDVVCTVYNFAADGSAMNAEGSAPNWLPVAR
jgi:hypothetical protein